VTAGSTAGGGEARPAGAAVKASVERVQKKLSGAK